MLIAYFTTDEVNEWMAERLAAECGPTLCPTFLKEQPVEDGFDALLFDWDSLPVAWREEALKMLLTRPLDCPVALHSYHLAEKHVQALRARGVQVRRRLEATLFHELFQAVVEAQLRLRGFAVAPATVDGRRAAETVYPSTQARSASKG